MAAPAGDVRSDRPSDETRQRWFARALLVVGLAAGFAATPRALRSFKKTGADGEAPNISATIIANAESPSEKKFSLAAVRGKPVLLDFWATWCGPCQAEAPIINGIAQRFRDRGLVVVGVNTSDDASLAERFAFKKGLTFPIVFDEGNTIAHDYQVQNLPTLVVISKTGKIVAVRHGITSDSDLEQLVRQVL